MTERKNTLKNPAISQVQISDILFITLKKWYWILASLTICVGGAYLYLLRSQPTYTRTAAIVIKDDSKGNPPQRSWMPSPTWGLSRQTRTSTMR